MLYLTVQITYAFLWWICNETDKHQEIEYQIINGTGYATAEEIKQQERIALDVSPRNKFSPDEKLVLALKMAEAIADLHGFKDGVIVHGDIQLCQYLINRDGQLKLNDFNRAEVMLWDTKKQDYCRFRSGLVYGNYRSPEEDEDEPLNEQIDVFSLGKHLELLRAVDHDSMYLCFFFKQHTFLCYIEQNNNWTYKKGTICTVFWLDYGSFTNIKMIVSCKKRWKMLSYRS